MPSLGYTCNVCRQYSVIVINEGPPDCPHCSNTLPNIKKDFNFDLCPLCGCRQFYIQKDFSQALGCLVMALGIVLVPVTYGLSLPVFALADWFLFKKFPMMSVCYRCGTEFKGFAIPAHFKYFMHHIGEKHERELEKDEKKL